MSITFVSVESDEEYIDNFDTIEDFISYFKNIEGSDEEEYRDYNVEGVSLSLLSYDEDGFPYLPVIINDEYHSDEPIIDDDLP